MSQNRPIRFKIESIDSLGQGVSKLDGKISFIPKTLPGEEGIAFVQAQKKGVTFARLSHFSLSSPERIKPECLHFNQCPSCHFLHTSYENELKFKAASFQNLFRKFNLPELKILNAPDRFGYRNRIQLHYDTKTRRLGMLDAKSSQIIPIPNCLIGDASVRAKLQEMYQDQSWLRFAPKNAVRGHVEIYHKDEKVQVSWNKTYASGGFTQVYSAMNEKLQVLIADWFGKEPQSVLDLFAGNGNLSKNIPYTKRLCVDIYKEEKDSDFFSQSLYEDAALANVLQQMSQRNLKAQNLILDPPRSGHQDLHIWLNELAPRRVAYVSCDPHTMVRDLQKVEGYQVTGAVMLDFFPSTFHFESLIFLERK